MMPLLSTLIELLVLLHFSSVYSHVLLEKGDGGTSADVGGMDKIGGTGQEVAELARAGQDAVLHKDTDVCNQIQQGLSNRESDREGQPDPEPHHHTPPTSIKRSTRLRRQWRAEPFIMTNYYSLSGNLLTTTRKIRGGLSLTLFLFYKNKVYKNTYT